MRHRRKRERESGRETRRAEMSAPSGDSEEQRLERERESFEQVQLPIGPRGRKKKGRRRGAEEEEKGGSAARRD
jgi:hypothetical protein